MNREKIFELREATGRAKRIHIIMGIFLLALFACEKSEFQAAGDFFHLIHKEASMPVWVKGNFDSDILIFTVHGGPGDSGMEHPLAQGYRMLEDDYLMVYWDQRFSGMSSGPSKKELQVPDQYIEDTKKMVELIKHKYPEKKMYIMGHSWGGQLSAGYLGRDNHDDLFHGWIDMDGSIYGELEFELMKEWLLERVPEKMVQPGANLEFWQVIIDYYNSDPNPGNYSEWLPYQYVSALGGAVLDYEAILEEDPIPYGQLVFKSFFTLSFYTGAFFEKEVESLWDNLNYTPELGNITIPSLLLWGAEDGIVPADVADYVYEHLGTDPSMKEVVKIPDCAHTPPHETPERFHDEVIRFVESTKNLK